MIMMRKESGVLLLRYALMYPVILLKKTHKTEWSDVQMKTSLAANARTKIYLNVFICNRATLFTILLQKKLRNHSANPLRIS